MRAKTKPKKRKPVATKNPHHMTDRMWAFCRRYVKQGFTNAAGAYRHAYPKCRSEKASESCASRLLTVAKVSAYLTEVKERSQERTQITADRVLKELGKLAFSNMENYAKWGPGGVTLQLSEDMDPDVAAAVAEVAETFSEKGGSIKFKLHDKRGALELIGKHFGMFTDKRAEEHGGEPAEELTPERTADLWERVKRIKTIELLEKMLVAASKKQGAKSP